jgi:hypothetical protein
MLGHLLLNLINSKPFQWSVLEVWYQEKFAGLGRRCDKNLNAKTYGSADYER